MAAEVPELPIPVSLISGRYFLFSIDAVTYLRREYNVCGVFAGTLPQIPQQNVFLGLPLQLMPEEARLLVEKGVVYVIDDTQVHKPGMRAVADEDRRRYIYDLEEQGRRASLLLASKKEEQREKALKKLKKSPSKSTTKSGKGSETNESAGTNEDTTSTAPEEADGHNEDLFAPSKPESINEVASSKASVSPEFIIGVTPATSQGLFPKPPSAHFTALPKAPSSYPLFAHLHSHGYFLSPGLRFGCQYVAYPGDSLRFHSHFLVVSAEWDEEIDLMDLVVGGRLGTGVKKGYLIGGAEKSDDVDSNMTYEAATNNVRTFSLEWAGM